MSTNDLIPAVVAPSALKVAEQITLSMGDDAVLAHLPPELKALILSRFIVPSKLDQPDMPLLGEEQGFRATFLKKISGNTKDKTFNGEEQLDGTVIGKSVFPKPFPFIALLAWTIRTYGYWDSDAGVAVTHCESRDGVTPSMVNEWGATACTSCPHHPDKRPKWGEDKNRSERCRQKICIIGIGGDWKDLYVLQIAGLGIISFYSQKMGKALNAAKRIGDPYFMTTFMLGTVKDERKNPQYEVMSVMPTIQAPGGKTKSLWVLDSDEKRVSTMAALEGLQKLCVQYRNEFQEAGRNHYNAQLEMEGSSSGDSHSALPGANAEEFDVT